MWTYTNEIRSDLKNQKIKGSEVEAFGDHLIDVLLTFIIVWQFGNYLRELENILVDGPTPLCVGRTWNQGFTTLGITANYFAQPHLDKKNMGFAFFSWFVNGKRLFIFSFLYYVFWYVFMFYLYFFIWFFVKREEI